LINDIKISGEKVSIFWWAESTFECK
jgi:hypothetical protein